MAFTIVAIAFMFMIAIRSNILQLFLIVTVITQRWLGWIFWQYSPTWLIITNTALNTPQYSLQFHSATAFITRTVMPCVCYSQLQLHTKIRVIVIIIISTILSVYPECRHKRHIAYDCNLAALCNTVYHYNCNTTHTLIISRVWRGEVFKRSKNIDAAAVYNHCCWSFECKESGLNCTTFT